MQPLESAEKNTGYFIRMLQPWRIASKDDCCNIVAFHRLAFDCARLPLKERLRARVDFSDSPISRSARRALVGCVRIGKISPEFAQGIVDECRLSIGFPQTNVITLHELLAAISPSLLDGFRDPMRGVMTSPFHHGLFGNNLDFIEAIDRLAVMDEVTGLDTLGQYIELYLRCRRVIVGLAMKMARGMSPISRTAWDPSEDFFLWWRKQWTRTIEVQFAPDVAAISLRVPVNVPEADLTAIRSAVSRVAQEYALLVLALGRTEDNILNFIELFVAELLDGLSGLLLNRPGNEPCPYTNTLTTTFASAAEYPTQSRFVKEVYVGQIKLQDVFNRFFTLRRQYLTLANSGCIYTLEMLGSCPFPDHGYLWVENGLNTEMQRLACHECG